jgi:hypothetical protein
MENGRAAGRDGVNMVQQAYCNGHRGFSGAKVWHVLFFHKSIKIA